MALKTVDSYVSDDMLITLVWDSFRRVATVWMETESGNSAILFPETGAETLACFRDPFAMLESGVPVAMAPYPLDSQ